MRKLLILTAAFLSLTSFSACSLREEFDARPSLVSKSGILVEQTAIDKENGTHFLIADDMTKTAVRSLTINLSGDEYLNNRVKAVGISNDSDNVFEISGLTVDTILSTKTKQKKQIDYMNTEDGFKLKYFDDWVLSKAKIGDIVFTAPLAANAKSASTVVIHQSPFNYEPKTLPDGTSDTALMAYYAQENTQKLDTNLIHKIGIDRLDAIKTLDGENVSYVLYRSGLVYQITYTAASPVSAEDNLTFESMLADFQFVSMSNNEVGVSPLITAGADVVSLPTDDVKSLSLSDMEMTDYDSLPYKFSGQYPTKWYYAGVKSSAGDGVLHHYGFSDQVITDKNEIIGLDILDGPLPTGGNKMTISGKDLVVFESIDGFTVYISLDKENFRFKGPLSYKNLILFMAASIGPVQK